MIACYKDIILLHRRVMDAWVNSCTQQCGPSVDRILDKGLPVFPKLESLAVAATVNFYDKLQKTSALYLLPLMAFNAINLNTGFEGLCPPGLGLPRYAEVASVLMEIIPRLLPTTDSQVSSLVSVVRAESNNGYDLLWRILKLSVPGFDHAIQINAPIWIGDDIFEFCLSFVLYFRLLVKKGLVHDEQTKSITFLQAVQEPAYVDVITTLQAHVDTFQSEDFGYLPPNLCMMGLAAQMNKHAKTRVRDIVPWIRRLDWQDGGNMKTTPEIQGYPSPQVCRTDLPRSRPRSKQWDSHDSREGRRHPKDAPGRPGMRGWNVRPDHNRRAWNPDIICAACKRRGHPALNCDMLAMALFLEKYMKSLITSADRDKVESAWLMRWREQLGNPS